MCPTLQAELQWQAQFGDIYRIKGLFGVGYPIIESASYLISFGNTQEDRLVVSDPKAVQYIFQTSGYNFLKQPERCELSRLTTGKGILWADGRCSHRIARRKLIIG